MDDADFDRRKLLNERESMENYGPTVRVLVANDYDVPLVTVNKDELEVLGIDEESFLDEVAALVVKSIGPGVTLEVEG